jgi:hypothetical protein
MATSFWDIAWAMLLAFLLGGSLVILATIIGGILVFKTKKESHESFFAVKPPLGASSNIDETDYRTHNEPEAEDPVKETFARMEADNLRFIRQMKEQAMKQEGTNGAE